MTMTTTRKTLRSVEDCSTGPISDAEFEQYAQGDSWQTIIRESRSWVVPAVSKAQAKDIRRYLRSIGSGKLRYHHHLPDGCSGPVFIKFLGESIQESLKGSVSGFTFLFNRNHDGSGFDPIHGCGSTDLIYRNLHAQPDASFIVQGRHHQTDSPNLVVEVLAPGTSTEDHLQKGENYLNHTPGVLVVVLLSRYDNGAMLAVLLTRPGGQGVPRVVNSVVSFGVVPLTAEMMISWINAFKTRGLSFLTQVVGVGFGGPACNGRGLPCYQIVIPNNLILAIDTAGTNQGTHNINSPPLTVDLYVVQNVSRPKR